MSGLLFLVFPLLQSAATLATTTTPAQHCEKAPAHAQPADALYRLGVAGDPDLFLPGELYTVSLQGVDSGEGPTPFIGFTIWAELDTEETEDGKRQETETSPGNFSLGVFQAYDAQTKAQEHCAPAVINATSHPKIEIQVIWNAPLSAVDICIKLCARAAGPAPSAATEKVSVLARKLCAAPAAPASFVRQPPIVEPCCACDEAKYEVTFEGMWSRNTHPRDFPPEAARAHFSDVIGASHTAHYRVWQEGRVASAGLRRLADDGATTALEKELKAESDHIRTIIKARGISWQQVAGGSGIPSTFAVFRVDAKHHLVSLAAKLAPSPDWIVGVSALELCNTNCTWRRAAILPLYPYDAGTDAGIAYTSPRQPTVPAAPVRALRPDWPKDPRSPFYNTNGDMRPYARLRLTRLRLYEKSCDADPGADRPVEPLGGSCATHEWGPWSPCSVTCGPGRASRQRHYVWPSRAVSDACRAPLTDHRRCHGPRRHCRAPTEYEPDPAESTGPCAVSAWSEWSPCEGCGVRARKRHYLVPRAYKRCHTGYRARTIMSQAIPCDKGPCERPPGDSENSTNFDWFFVDKPSGQCPVTSWGEWSPCSARCGRGHMLRTRLYVSRDSRVQHEVTRRLLRDWNTRFAELQGLTPPNENITSGDTGVERLVHELLERCQFTLTQQEALCDGDENDCVDTNLSKDTCKLSMSVGPCRGYVERWFWDVASGTCEPFGYSGCGGNGNNFRTRDDCRAACADNATRSTGTTVMPAISEPSAKKSKQLVTNEDNEVMQNDAPVADEEDIECAVTQWQGWSKCFGECDFAIKLNFRLVSQTPSGSGKQCPILVKSRSCRPNHCRKVLQHPTSDQHFKEENSVKGNRDDYD